MVKKRLVIIGCILAVGMKVEMYAMYGIGSTVSQTLFGLWVPNGFKYQVQNSRKNAEANAQNVIDELLGSKVKSIRKSVQIKRKSSDKIMVDSIIMVVQTTTDTLSKISKKHRSRSLEVKLPVCTFRRNSLQLPTINGDMIEGNQECVRLRQFDK